MRMEGKDADYDSKNAGDCRHLALPVQVQTLLGTDRDTPLPYGFAYITSDYI